MNNQTDSTSYQGQYDQATSVAPGSGRMDTIFKPYPPQPNIKNKFDKIAELFELDVLSDKEALEACKKVIQQHSRATTSGDTIKE